MTTNSSSPLPMLSEGTVAELRALREGDKQVFYAFVVSLRSQKWPLRAIAAPLNVSRTAVQLWERLYDGSTPLSEVEKLPPTLSRRLKTTYVRLELTTKQQNELKRLASEASKVRRYTDPGAQSRKDAKRLEDLLHEYTAEGASLGHLASACGVSRSAIAQRLRKAGK